MSEIQNEKTKIFSFFTVNWEWLINHKTAIFLGWLWVICYICDIIRTTLQATLLTPSAFERLFKSNYERLYYFAYDLVRDEESARDVVSEVFANAWQRRELLDPSRVLSYLFTSVRNRSLDQLKASHRNVAIVEEVTSLTDHFADSDWQEHEERVLALLKGMEQLPERSRRVLNARFFEMKSNQEVAEMIGITVDGVKKIVQRSFATLRESLGKKTLTGVPLRLLLCIYW